MPESLARPFVQTHHYSRSWPSATASFAMFSAGGPLVGVAVFGVPMQAAVLTNVLPDLRPYEQSLELSRLVLRDEVPANAESWFVAQAFRQLAAASPVRGVVSFSDPVPRERQVTVVEDDGRRSVLQSLTLMPGHVGTVYQALGAHHTAARSTARTLTLIPRYTDIDDELRVARRLPQGAQFCDWVVLSDRALSKIRRGERGWEGAARRLLEAGAPDHGGQHGGLWLTEALQAVGARRVRHPGNFRYVFALGNRSERRSLRIALPAGPYPKQSQLVAAA